METVAVTGISPNRGGRAGLMVAGVGAAINRRNREGRSWELGVRSRGYLKSLPAVFISGSTGYLRRPLTEALLARRWDVHALVRPGSESKVAAGAIAVVGNALEAASFAARIPPEATLVHLVGTPHPSPAKAAEFRRVDLVSIQASVSAARTAAVRHFVYVSVAHPAPIMHAYIAVRREGEALVQASGIPATILRPWYVLGPGHWWPSALMPVYAILRQLPSTREAAHRLGLVTHRAMVAALVRAVETPPAVGVRVLDVPAINRLQLSESAPR